MTREELDEGCLRLNLPMPINPTPQRIKRAEAFAAWIINTIRHVEIGNRQEIYNALLISAYSADAEITTRN